MRIFIDRKLNFKIHEDLSFVKDFIECIFVEIIQPKIICDWIFIGLLITEVSLFSVRLTAILDKINVKNPRLTF